MHCLSLKYPRLHLDGSQHARLHTNPAPGNTSNSRGGMAAAAPALGAADLGDLSQLSPEHFVSFLDRAFEIFEECKAHDSAVSGRCSWPA